MTSITRAMPIWPGLDMGRQAKAMARKSAQGSSKMATVMAARMIEEKSVKRIIKK